ncbi:DUF4870 domain-containing protein [Olivibacter jilunii]|uniref:DUF4870 domain-containing protein n=1 Tax=Olivibacter jilunii TaxID=985016 RepID=UPI00102F77A9|nr:DUF4870 domain-containing protein [Olivibacter jilunii]
MTNKNMSIIAYLTIIGWVIAYLNYQKSEEKSSLVGYHLSQALGIFIFHIILSILTTAVLTLLPSLATLCYLILLIPLILLLLGIITAFNEVKKPVPFIGKLFEGKFNF